MTQWPLEPPKTLRNFLQGVPNSSQGVPDDTEMWGEGNLVSSDGPRHWSYTRSPQDAHIIHIFLLTTQTTST